MPHGRNQGVLYLDAVFALRFQSLPSRNSSLKIFKHEKEEKLAGLKGKFAGPAQFLVAEGLEPALNAKTEMVQNSYFAMTILY